MEVGLLPRDRSILDKGLELVIKGAEDVSKKSERLSLPTMAAETLKGHAESARMRMADRVGEDGVLDGDYDFPHEEVDAMKIGVFLLLEKIGKVESAQEELSIPTDDTESRAADARDLADRLSGQLALSVGR
jgi:hypothetical protein